MKGQFFILGAVLVLAVLLSGVPFIVKTLPEYRIQPTDNIMAEYPKALNFGLRENKSTEYLEDFSLFVKSNFGAAETIWIVSEPSGQGLKITAGNFFNEEKTIKITANSEEKTVAVGSGLSAVVSYETVPDTFPLAVQWDRQEKNMLWMKNKANIFVSSDFSFGKNLVRKEVIG
jgi:hypothetical protein